MGSLLRAGKGLALYKYAGVLFHLFASIVLALFLPLVLVADDSTGIICQTLGSIAPDALKSPYLIEGSRLCFKQPAVDNPATARTFARPNYVWLWSFLKGQSASIVLPVKHQPEPADHPLLTDSSPASQSIPAILLKDSLIPDDLPYRQHRNLGLKIKQALNDWQHLSQQFIHKSYQPVPTVAVSVRSAQVRMVISEEQAPRTINLLSFYRDHLDALVQSYLSLTDDETISKVFLEWASNLPAAAASGGGGGDDDDDNNGSKQSYDDSEPEPLILVYGEKIWPELDSEQRLFSQSLENKRRLLKILKKKLRKAVAEGSADLIKILNNRIMLVDVELGELERSGQSLSPAVLPLFKASFIPDYLEVQRYDEQTLRQTLAEHSAAVNIEPDNLILLPDTMSPQQQWIYFQWLQSASGFIYTELKQRLKRQLRQGDSHTENNEVAIDILRTSIEACVKQFLSLRIPGSSAPRIGRQVPDSGTQKSKGGNTSSKEPNTHSQRQPRQPSTMKPGTESHGEDDNDGDDNHYHNKHTKNNNCPACNNGPCKEKVDGGLPEESRQLPTPTTSKKPAGALNSYDTASHGGRTISLEGASSIISDARKLAKTDQALSKRVVAGRKTNAEIVEAGKELERSNQAIKSFIETYKLNREYKVNYDLKHGFSEATQQQFILMSQLKDLIEQHTELLNQIYGVIAPSGERLKAMNKAARVSAVKKDLRPEERAALDLMSESPEINERKALYWNERNYIRVYSAFCRQRFRQVCETKLGLKSVGELKELNEAGAKKIFMARVEEFFIQTLEWMEVLIEVIQCGIGQNDETKLKESIQSFDLAAETLASMLQESEKLYMVSDKQETLRKILEGNKQYFEHWLEIFSESTKEPHTLPTHGNAITAALVLDKPDIALKLQERFNHLVKSGDLPAEEFPRLCISLISAVTWLYDRPEPLGEHKKRVEGAEKIVNTFAGLVRHFDENRLISDFNRASMLNIFSLIESICHREVQQLRAMEQGVLDRGAELVREEDKQRQKIQERLEKRELRRQKRLAKQLVVRAAPPPVPSVEESAGSPDREPDKDSLQLHPSLRKGLEAIAQNKPNREIKSAFKHVIDDENASVFDKAQAHYGYADILTIRLAPRLEKLNALVDATNDYHRVLEADQLPSFDHEFRFNDALRDIKGQVEGINLAVLEIAQAIEAAFKVFYELSDEQGEFLDQLVDLHEQAEGLIEKAEKASQCCKKLLEIYKKRGAVLKKYLAGRSTGQRKSNPAEHRQIIEESIRDIQSCSLNLDGSLNYLKRSLNREKIETSVKDMQQPISGAEGVAAVEGESNDSASLKSLPEARLEAPQGGMKEVAGVSVATPSVTPFEEGLTAEPAPSTSTALVEPKADKPQGFEFPIGLFTPQDVFTSFEESLNETGLSWRLGPDGLTTSEPADPASAGTEPGQPNRSKKKGKGKKRRATAKKRTETNESLPVATYNLMQLRVRDYLKKLIASEQQPNGTPLPANFDLETVKARIQAKTFLSKPCYLEDFAILADALNISIRFTAQATEVFHCKPGLGKPVKIEMNEYPNTPYLPLEYFGMEKERCWYPSLAHLFSHVEEETARKLAPQ